MRVWPRPLSQRNGPQWKDYCRVKVLLHIRHRDLSVLTDNNSVSWPDLFEHYYEIIESALDLLSLPVDTLENNVVDDESDQDCEDLDDIKGEIRPDWMILSEMRPDAEFEIASDLGFRDVDRNYDWIADLKMRCPDLDLAAIPNFIQQACVFTNLNIASLPNCAVDPQSLNEKQMLVYRRIESHYANLLTDQECIDPLRLIVLGTAGTGKSYLIKMIQDQLCKIGRDHDVFVSPVMLLALTGVAAFNIHGITIYLSFSIPISSKSFDLAGENLKKLQKKLDGVYYFVIDKKSMVGHHMLGLVDLRLRQAFPNMEIKSISDSCQRLWTTSTRT
ncbi:hypothetical protein RclHR1_05150005 [Rhizophagus clarus]|uniref:ATP-dependent DNA helicase n=1 Tax=Rhizophagus clarus TaxID=94130 RepID=A0A2Z6RYK3_9GLOM|nr:hypothetical protein RclHR1_05150005 [Rhizophagus clarus]GES93131.1 ATP-dependent DNA helicase Pif1 [Rhizophagus clarus]